MDKLEAMRVFSAVVEEGSFVDASRVLDLSAPAVTRSVARLESALGVPLFHRSTRHVRLTDSGQRYYTHAKAILESVAEAEAAVTGSFSEPSGRLTVTAPSLFGHKYVVPIIAEYVMAHGKVSVNSLFLDRVTNLLEENLDVAIRIGNLADSSLFATHVGDIRRVVCASPAYLAERGVPQSPADLAEHDLIHATAVEPLTVWAFGKHKVKVASRFQCNQNSDAVKAAVMGLGLTRVMSYQVADELAAGSLQLVLEDLEPPTLPVHVVYLEGRKANAKIRAFVDLAVERLRGNALLQ
ncbi:LysR family transcriptional regulator [Mangrovimicrobium sediminis]|uniref:LysR family transcriptional regulator n=2 Tax=Mangrovimicrobium sediminis TaxID=2562682 RepID=A0A4Z0LZY0_9GAMM|nr:LysR family transcriptional regulator [Haliea sp. SAOS-164]